MISKPTSLGEYYPKYDNQMGGLFSILGSIVGTIILPGVGTTIGAAVGGGVDSLTKHKSNPTADATASITSQVETGIQQGSITVDTPFQHFIKQNPAIVLGVLATGVILITKRHRS